ncbi:MAG: hypothetical protein AAGF74_02125 [Pseudomonadota bacterium]
MSGVNSNNEVDKLKGGLEVLDILREEFSQWADEAQETSKHEALDNVLAHVASVEDEYKRRLNEATGG